LQKHFFLVYADPNRLDEVTAAQLSERTITAGAKRADDYEMGVPTVLHCTDVAHEENVDSPQAKPLQVSSNEP
jgi:hypothetical protein